MKNYCPDVSESLSPVCQPFFAALQRSQHWALPHQGLAGCAQGNGAEDNTGEHRAELSRDGRAAYWESALETHRQEMGRISPVPAQHKAAQSAAELLADSHPEGLKGPKEAPEPMSRLRLRHIACCGASQAHPDGDPAVCGHWDLTWRPLQYDQNKGCCPCAPSLHPATRAGCSFRARHKILLLRCRKAAVISLTECLIFNFSIFCRL